MGDEIIPFNNFHFSKLDEIREMITNLEVLQERFNYFGYDSDINLDLLKPEESQILTFLMEDKPLVKEYNIDGSGLLNIELAGIKLLILVEKNEVDDYYILNNFFERTWKLVLVDSDSNKKTTISQFLVLKKEGLLADNIQADRILEDIKEKHANNMEIEIINNFLLEAIKAYDEKEFRKEELQKLIVKLSNWLHEEIEEDYTFMNVAQIKFRLGKLNSEDIERLNKLENDDLEIQIGKLILIEQYSEARIILDNMENEERERFISYPIYNIMEKATKL